MPSCFCCGRSRNEKSKRANISFHKFPTKENIKAKWVDFVNENSINTVDVTKNSLMCSVHFDSGCFIFNQNMKILKKTAVPTFIVARVKNPKINYTEIVKPAQPNVSNTNEPSTSDSWPTFKRTLVKLSPINDIHEVNAEKDMDISLISVDPGSNDDNEGVSLLPVDSPTKSPSMIMKITPDTFRIKNPCKRIETSLVTTSEIKLSDTQTVSVDPGSNDDSEGVSLLPVDSLTKSPSMIMKITPDTFRIKKPCKKIETSIATTSEVKLSDTQTVSVDPGSNDDSEGVSLLPVDSLTKSPSMIMKITPDTFRIKKPCKKIETSIATTSEIKLSDTQTVSVDPGSNDDSEGVSLLPVDSLTKSPSMIMKITPDTFRIKKPCKKIETSIATTSEIKLSDTPHHRFLKRTIRTLTDTMAIKDHKLKTVLQTVRRQQKKIASLKAIITRLQEENHINEDVSFILLESIEVEDTSIE